MTTPAGEIFEFGDFTLDPTDRLLLLRGQPLRLTPKTFDLLVALVRHRGSLMTKGRLLDMIWPKVFVAEINLSVNISILRKLLMRSRDRPTFIETVPTHGYRFVAPVKVRSGTATLFLRTGPPRSGKRLPPSEDARLACLQGRYHWNRRTAEGLDRAIQHYWRSLAFDAEFAPAHAGLADAHAAKGYLSYVAPADAFPAAARHAAMALEFDDKLAEPHASLGYVKLYHGWDWDGAEREFRRAIELDRSNAAAHQWLATFLLAAGRAEEALDEIRRAHAGEPLSRAINTDVGFVHYYSGRYDEAIKQLDAVLEMDPEFPPAHLWRGRSLQEIGQHDAAIAAFQRVDEKLQGWPVSIAARGHAQAVCGRTAAAHETIAELRQLATRTFVTSYGIALVYAGWVRPMRLSPGSTGLLEKDRTGWSGCVSIRAGARCAPRPASWNLSPG
jgi:DNA-binding winged helix-turn-helix (wHTH) protein/tetratricopeptide (TPR) repeat protein